MKFALDGIKHSRSYFASGNLNFLDKQFRIWSMFARGYAFTCKHNDCRRVSAVCKTEGCPWQIRASRLATAQLIIVRKLHKTHTCGAGTSAANRPQTSKKLVPEFIDIGGSVVWYLCKVAKEQEMKGSVGAILSAVVLEQHSHLEDKVGKHSCNNCFDSKLGSSTND